MQYFSSPHKRTRFFLSGLLLILITSSAIAQERIPQLTRIDESSANITLDGFLDEEVWQDLPVLDGMKVTDPDTLADTPYETHIRFFYTEQGIYVGAINYQPAESLMARMTSRDNRVDRDGFTVDLDSSGEGLYGFKLRINLGDSMTDGTYLPESRTNLQWDGAWSARTQPLDDGWSVEFFIPWEMMALPQSGDTRQIGFHFERQVGHLSGESWANPALPSTVNEFISAFTKYELRDIEPRRQLTFYPFASTVYDGVKYKLDNKVGTDIYWRPTTNNLLSATLNPDFGTVESDDVVVNLTAFETFFPEKRPFFLEGQGIFSTSPRDAGFSRGPEGPIALLNTKRIGGAPQWTVPGDIDVVPTDLSAPTDLLGAGKFTGQSGNWQYGFLGAVEDDTVIKGIREDGTRVEVEATGRDFAVARLLYEDTSGGGRRSIGWMGTDVSHPDIDATVNGIDMHYFSSDNRIVVDGQLMHSDVNGVTGAGGFADMSFTPSRGVRHSLRTNYIDDKLDINDLGFLQRNDSMGVDYVWSWNQSDVPNLRSRSSSVYFINQWNTDGEKTRGAYFWNRSYTFLSNNSFNYSLQIFPEGLDDRLGGGSADFKTPLRYGGSLGWRSDSTKQFSWNASVNLGQESIGPATTSTSAGVSWRPDDRFSVDFRVGYSDREALLRPIGNGQYASYESHQWSPTLEGNYFITAKQQFRVSLQWIALKAFDDRYWQADQEDTDFLNPIANPDGIDRDFVINRLTFQARYRWELAPLSDLFIVYTRGNSLPINEFDDFPGLFQRAWNDPIADTVAIKLRYRFGS